MPWTWEIDALVPGNVDWYRLWNILSAADGGSGEAELIRKVMVDSQKDNETDLMRGSPHHHTFPHSNYFKTAYAEIVAQPRERSEVDLRRDATRAAIWQTTGAKSSVP